MSNREKILRRARMLASGLMPRDYRGHMLKEGYPHGLHDWMQRNERVRP
jgi:hypothetical protein